MKRLLGLCLAIHVSVTTVIARISAEILLQLLLTQLVRIISVPVALYATWYLILLQIYVQCSSHYLLNFQILDNLIIKITKNKNNQYIVIVILSIHKYIYTRNDTHSLCTIIFQILRRVFSVSVVHLYICHSLKKLIIICCDIIN